MRRRSERSEISVGRRAGQSFEETSPVGARALKSWGAVGRRDCGLSSSLIGLRAFLPVSAISTQAVVLVSIR